MALKMKWLLIKQKQLFKTDKISHNLFLGSLMDTIYIDIEITMKYVSGK